MKKSSIVISITLVINLIFTCLLGVPTYAKINESFLYLNVRQHGQGNTNNCWAVSTATVIEFYRSKFPYSDIVKKYDEDNGGPDASIIKALKDYNIDSQVVAHDQRVNWIYHAVSFEEVKTNIDSNSPIIACIKYKKSTDIKKASSKGKFKKEIDPGHAVVIYGYYESGNYKNISYMDPQKKNSDGTNFYTMSFEDFIDNSVWKLDRIITTSKK